GDLPVGRAAEGEPQVLQLDDHGDRLFAHRLDGVLVAQVVAALDGVEGVPLGVVFLEVGEGGADAALRRAGVRAGGVELGDDRRAQVGVARQVDGRHQPRPAAAHHQRVVAVRVDHAARPGTAGLKVRSAKIPQASDRRTRAYATVFTAR